MIAAVAPMHDAPPSRVDTSVPNSPLMKPCSSSTNCTVRRTASLPSVTIFQLLPRSALEAMVVLVPTAQSCPRRSQVTASGVIAEVMGRGDHCFPVASPIQTFR